MQKVLSKFPNYSDATELPSVKASDLTQAQFYSEFVYRNEPCRIVGAIEHWPAYARWSSTEYFKQRIENQIVLSRSQPPSEWVNMLYSDELRPTLIRRNAESVSERLLHEVLDQMAEPAQESLVLHGMPVTPGSPLGLVLGDIGDLSFLPRPPRPRIYDSHRAFLYRNSYTDWHFHPSDEGFMIQVAGPKEVLLLPPTQVVWDTMAAIAESYGYIFDIEFSDFAGAGQLQPIRCVVEPGDMLYIPVFWWHAVESLDDRFGVTLASTFATPLHINGDTRYPAVRRLLRKSRSFQAKVTMLGLIAYSAGYRAFRKSHVARF